MLHGLPDKQQGMTWWGLLYVVITLAIIVVIGVKCVPVYMNYYDVRGGLSCAVDNLSANTHPGRTISVHTIRRSVQRCFDGGYVDNVHGRDVKVHRVDGGRVLQIKYTAKKHLFFNIDFVFHFDAKTRLPNS